MEGITIGGPHSLLNYFFITFILCDKLRAVYFMEFMDQTVWKEFITFQKKIIILIVN